MADFLASLVTHAVFTWPPVTCAVIGFGVGYLVFGGIGSVVGAVLGCAVGIILFRNWLRDRANETRRADENVSILSRAIRRVRR